MINDDTMKSRFGCYHEIPIRLRPRTPAPGATIFSNSTVPFPTPPYTRQCDAMLFFLLKEQKTVKTHFTVNDQSFCKGLVFLFLLYTSERHTALQLLTIR